MKLAHPRPLSLLVASVVLALPAAAELAAQNARYRVMLTNGNEIYSKYKPVEASYDSNKMILMTDQSNVIALHKDDIQEMVAEVEELGFGRRLNDTTVVVGYSANDNLSEEEMQQMQQTLDAMFPGLPLNFRSGMPMSTTPPPIFSEPGEIGRGIPVGFVTGVQPSLGNFPVVPQPPP